MSKLLVHKVHLQEYYNCKLDDDTVVMRYSITTVMVLLYCEPYAKVDRLSLARTDLYY
jgi:hypothetical protein